MQVHEHDFDTALAIGYRLLAISPVNPVDEGGEHLGHPMCFGSEVLVMGWWQVSEIASEEQVVVEFVNITHRDSHEPRQFRIAVPAAAFGNIRWNR